MAVFSTTLLPPTRSGRTLFISACVLGAFALLQLAMLCWYLLRSTGKAVPEGAIIHFAETTEPAASATGDVPFRRNPFPPEPAAGPATGNNFPFAGPSAPGSAVVAPSIERPTPAVSDGTAVAGMIDHARRLRQDGDATTALAELRQAQTADPDNPQIIAELGITYEAMQLTDRAFEQWQRLYSMGDSVGALYYLADEKLHNAPAASPAPGAGLAATGTAPGGAAFPDGALLKITDVHLDEEEDPAADKKVSLKIVVKNRPGSAVDPKKVVIQTFFYDLVDGKDIVQTNALTGYAWLTAPVNWKDDKSEVLETTYTRPKASAEPTPGLAAAADGAKHAKKTKGRADVAPSATPTPPVQVRTYLGYTVRLYYDRQLQDVQADPLRLLQQFPPQLTLPEE